jgi:hypothetical protein
VKSTVCLLVLSVIFFSTIVTAEVPGLVHYQGTLTDEYGVALDTTVSITFSIYDDSTGGNTIWTETQSAVVVTKGLFNVLLGSSNAISDTAFNDSSRWLGVQVESDPEMEPRQRIASVGYSFRAAKADTAEYSRNAPTVSDGDWTISADDIYSNVSGNVGIGTSSPGKKLHIAGNVMVNDTLFSSILSSDIPVHLQTTGKNQIYIDTSGNVGIGVVNPSVNLEVDGIVRASYESQTGGFGEWPQFLDSMAEPKMAVAVLVFME